MHLIARKNAKISLMVCKPLSIDIDQLSHLKIIDNISSPSCNSLVSILSSPSIISLWSRKDDATNLYISLVRIYFHYNQTTISLNSAKGFPGKNCSLILVLKKLMERTHILEHQNLETAKQRHFIELLWWKSRELLKREIYFYRIIQSKKHEEKYDTPPSFLPKSFFYLFDKSQEPNDELLFLEDIENKNLVHKGDVLFGLNKAQVFLNIF